MWYMFTMTTCCCWMLILQLWCTATLIEFNSPNFLGHILVLSFLPDMKHRLMYFLQVVSLEMCDGPVHLPELTFHSFIPVMGEGSRVEEVRLTMEFKSSVPLEAEWFPTYKPGYFPQRKRKCSFLLRTIIGNNSKPARLPSLAFKHLYRVDIKKWPKH